MSQNGKSSKWCNNNTFSRSQAESGASKDQKVKNTRSVLRCWMLLRETKLSKIGLRRPVKNGRSALNWPIRKENYCSSFSKLRTMLILLILPRQFTTATTTSISIRPMDSMILKLRNVNTRKDSRGSRRWWSWGTAKKRARKIATILVNLKMETTVLLLTKRVSQR